MTRIDLADVAEALPYPLGLKLQTLRAEARARADGGEAANIAFTIAAFNGLAIRLAALIAIEAYVRAGAADNGVNQAIVDKLRQPADGAWRDVASAILPRVPNDAHAQRIARWLATSAAVPTRGEGWEMPARAISGRIAEVFAAPSEGKKRKGAAPALPKAGSQSNSKANNVDGALGDLVSLRNELVHGTAPSDEEVDLALLRVEAIARALHNALGGATLYVREGEKIWRVMGHVPQPLDAGRPTESVATLSSLELEEGVPTLVFTDGTPSLPLAPLLRFRPGANGESGSLQVDELFFINAAALERLHYVGFRAGAQADGKELGTYEAFKAFWQKIPVTPTPKDPAIVYDELAAFHAQYFVGRGEVLDEIASALGGTDEPGRYVELRALAGMGKSAVLARLYARQRPGMRAANDEPHPSSRASSDDPLPGAWAFHFCAQTEGREYALVALRSVCAQLCDRVGIKREQWLSNDLKELKEERLPGLFAEVAKRAGRCVVVLDALDESTGSDEDALAGCLPEHLPDGVSVVISWRVDAEGSASRVDRQLARIPAAKRRALTTANPLAGLERAHVAEFLAKVRGESAPEATLEAVWTSATKDGHGADPFFLRFVAEGVRDGRVDLERAETVPASLEDAFEGQWLTLPTDKGFLAQRVLLLLGILREYGDDELVAELIARDPQYQADPDAASPLGPEDIALVRQKLGKLLVYDGERYGLFHDRFRRFLVGEQKDPIAEALGEL